jgi:hypothetical protein
LGIGDWGLGIGPNPQSPIPNPQSPIPNPQSPIPNPQSPFSFLKKDVKISFIIYKIILKIIIINIFIKYGMLIFKRGRC